MSSLTASPAQFQSGILTTADGSVTTSHELPVPQCSPGVILIKVYSVALNPSDYKMPNLAKTAGLLVGCDFAGEIVEIGNEANANQTDRAPWRIGERVCGAVHGSNIRYPGWGAFAQYIEADPVVLTRVPEGWSWEEGAAVGGSCVGAVGLALFHQMGLRLPVIGNETLERMDLAERDKISRQDLSKVVLVYGGSTASGTMALQLLRLAGYIPITVCSSHNNALVRSYGAIACFDYHSEDCAQQIKTYTKNSLALVLDCISTLKSAAICYAAIGRAGGRYAALEMLPQTATAGRRAVRYTWAMGPVMYGRKIDLGDYSSEPNLEAREFGRKWYALVERLLRNGDLKPHPVRVLESEKGWSKAILDGLKTLKKGKVSGEKLVVNVE